ncbi:hypothetical protein FBU59_001426, partial [Linderina macrospora]
MDAFIEHLVQNGEQNRSSEQQLLATSVSLETAQQLSQALSSRLDSGKEKIRVHLHENYDTYLNAVSEASETQAKVSELLRGIDELELSFGDEDTGIRTRLLSAIDKQTQAEQRLGENQTVLECLRALAEINGQVQRLDML